MSVRLFVGNLPYDATEQDIREHFSSVGNLSYVFIPLDRETGKKRGFAFVEFADPAHAQAAIRQFNNQPFKGRPLAVNEARARESSPGPRPPGGGGFRPSPGPRPLGPPMRSPMPDFGDPGGEGARSDRPRKQFGPDAKPARSRAQKFRPEGGKKAFKEKFTGQIFDVDDTEDAGNEEEVDNFATPEEGEDNDE
jgi:RNA recognition motif-containing protein